MERKLTPVVLLAVCLGTGATSRSQGPAARDKIEVVAVGEIVDIDPAKASFVLRSRDVEPGSSRNDGLHGDIGIGIQIGRRGRFPQSRDPFPSPGRSPVPTGVPDPFPPFPPGDDGEDLPASTAPPRYTRSRVLTNAFTRIVQDGQEIDFSDLSEGDRVVVTGEPKGSEVAASLIERRRAVIPR